MSFENEDGISSAQALYRFIPRLALKRSDNKL